MKRGDGLFKAYLSNPDYFAPQVRATLFPEPDEKSEFGARWARQPIGMSLEIGEKQAADLSLSVDFLEIIQASLPPGITFGLVHLSMAAKSGDNDGGGSDDDAMLLTTRLLEEEYRAAPEDGPYIALQGKEGLAELDGTWLHTALAVALFGASHETATRAHIMSLACLDESVPESDERVWRRALGRGKSLVDARADLARSAVRDRDIARTDSFGATDIAFFGQATTLTSKKHITKWLFTFRTYWCESVLFALLQQCYLEHYARELAALGPRPFGKPIDELFDRWVAFLNVLWWREPSYTTDVPGRIVTHVHRQHNTTLLFGDVEKAFATYVEARQHHTQDAERIALRSLQTYGAIFALVGTAATVTQVADVGYVHGRPGWLLMAILVPGAIAGLGAFVLLRRSRRSR